MSVFLKALEAGTELDCLASLHCTEESIYLTVYSGTMQKFLEKEFKEKAVRGSYTVTKNGFCHKWTIMREGGPFRRFKQEAEIFYAYLKARTMLEKKIQG